MNPPCARALRAVLPLCAALALAACASLPHPAPGARKADTPGLSDLQAEIRRDLLESATRRYGAGPLARALAAERFVLAKHYRGMPPPPYDSDGRPIEPVHPVGLAFYEEGRWRSFGPPPDPGARDLPPFWTAQLEAALADPALAAEPDDGGPLGCTDAGASYLMTRSAPGGTRIAKGHCGGSPRTEALVFLTLRL